MKTEPHEYNENIEQQFSLEGAASSSEGASPEPEEKGKEKRPHSGALVEFLEAFQKENEIENKIRLSIDFMRAALSQSGSPRFKDFWEGRKVCLPLFKENLNPALRAQLWAEYIELSSEARRLKEILDEQSVFHVEQIELAIQSIEKDLERYDLLLLQIPEIDFPEACETLLEKKQIYNSLQRELHLLNTLASRVNGLRKEVIKTEMRVRHKNKFFERLSAVGDRIFPKRKELIKKISDEFMEDVQKFISRNFQGEGEPKISLFGLREEIKDLQGIAKLLTLNTHSFTETRLKLSECWDKVKGWEKERKKEFAQKKVIFKQNFDLAYEKIKALAEYCKEENAVITEANKRFEEILDYMKDLELGRDEVRALKDELHKTRRPILDKARSEEYERERREKEIEQQKKDKVVNFRNRLNELLQQAESIDAEMLVQKRDELQLEFEQMSLNKSEKQLMERIFKQLRDALVDKKEKAVLALSADDQQSLDQLNALLQERKDLRVEIKTQLENNKKALAGSGFDFEKAMMVRDMIDAEKERLDKVNASIKEIEEKIAQIEG